ncbi:MAG: hypothetical protein ACRDMV_10675 [Streptosporangiales bacterium]
MSTSCPVCGTPLHPEERTVTTVAGYLAHADGCAAALAAALPESHGKPQP